MNAKAKRIHSLKRFLWVLGIVNLIALLMLLTIPAYTISMGNAMISEARSQSTLTDNEQLLMSRFDSVVASWGRATIWTCVLLIMQIIVFVFMDRRLTTELRIDPEQIAKSTQSGK